VTPRAVALVGAIEQRESAQFSRRKPQPARERAVVSGIERPEIGIELLVLGQREGHGEHGALLVVEDVLPEHLAELIRIGCIGQARDQVGGCGVGHLVPRKSGARPSRLKPPVGVPSAAQLNAGVRLMYCNEGTARKPGTPRFGPPNCTDRSLLCACANFGSWQVAQDIAPDADKLASLKSFSPRVTGLGPFGLLGAAMTLVRRSSAMIAAPRASDTAPVQTHVVRRAWSGRLKLPESFRCIASGTPCQCS
jgi:hypothetical protein